MKIICNQTDKSVINYKDLSHYELILLLAKIKSCQYKRLKISFDWMSYNQQDDIIRNSISILFLTINVLLDCPLLISILS